MVLIYHPTISMLKKFQKILKEFINRSYKVKFDSVKNITDPQKEWMRSGFKEFFGHSHLEFKKIEF